jgi:hypothetical protein
VPVIVGLALTPVAALIGTLPLLVLYLGAGGSIVLAVLAIGVGLGSVFALPVTSVVLPLTFAICRRANLLYGPLFVVVGFAAGALSPWAIYRAMHVIQRDVAAFSALGAFAGAATAGLYVQILRKRRPSDPWL